MSLSSARSNLNRTQSALADLVRKDAGLARKEADLSAKLNKATEAAGKAKTPSTLSAKLRDAERAQANVAKMLKERADLAKKIADKRKEEHRHQEALSREEAKERKKEADAVAKLQREQQRRQSDLQAQMKGTMRELSENVSRYKGDPDGQVDYDAFICHATEDKASFVEGIATELQSRGLTIWYDNFTLKWGDKLRQEIDKGLRASKFGVVVLSKSFFEKGWPQEELDGLFQMEMAKRTRILPIWHDITKNELEAQSPMLASRLGMNTATLSTREIADALEALVRDGEGTAS